METHTKIKIGLSIILCLFLLALIGRKRRENFQNATVQEMRPSHSGYEIKTNQMPNSVPRHRPRHRPAKQSYQCAFTLKTSNERAASIQKDLAEAKQQLKQFIDKEQAKASLKPSRYDADIKYNNSCKILKYPAII